MFLNLYALFQIYTKRFGGNDLEGRERFKNNSARVCFDWFSHSVMEGFRNNPLYCLLFGVVYGCAILSCTYIYSLLWNVPSDRHFFWNSFYYGGDLCWCRTCLRCF